MQIFIRGIRMQTEFREMYLHLFNAVSDALELLAQGRAAEADALLKRAQCECEELYIESGPAGPAGEEG